MADLIAEAPTVDAVVLPFRPGESCWYVEPENGYRIKKYDEKISGVAYFGGDWFEVISSDGEFAPVGEPFCCVSMEQAMEVRQRMLSQLTMEQMDYSIRVGHKHSPSEWAPFLEEIKELFLKKVDSLL